MSCPKITSAWTRIIEYPRNHLNDFCLFKGLDGRWHAVGIMGAGTWASETSLFHCSSAELYGPYAKHPPLLAGLAQGKTQNAAPQKHAPFVVVRNGIGCMFLRRPPGTNLLVTSPDGFRWTSDPVVVFEQNDARDACIRDFAGIYHWYYCQWQELDGKGRSCIMLRRSRDLEHWDDPLPVHVDTSREVAHSHLESPFVVRAAGRYWLFVRNRALDEACITTVFCSDSPKSFASGTRAWDAELPGIHAPELVRDQGRWHIARVSGPPDHLPCAPKTGGWIELAGIDFAGAVSAGRGKSKTGKD